MMFTQSKGIGFVGPENTELGRHRGAHVPSIHQSTRLPNIAPVHLTTELLLPH